MGNKISRGLQALVVLGGMIALTVLAKHYEYPDIQVSHIEEVVIPGLTEEYEFLFLTDLHLAVKTRDDIGPLGDADARMAFFANAKGTQSAEHLSQWVDYANQHQFDAVLMGGDMNDYYSDEIAEYLLEGISQLEMPYLYTLGNHELYSPWKEAVPETSVIYELFQNKNTAFQVLEYEDFVICAIDNNEYQVNQESLEKMREWLSEHPEKPMILLAHVPFYTEQIAGLKDASIAAWGQPLIIGEGAGDTTEVTRAFMNLVFSEKSPVAAVFTGDNHFYYKGNLTDSIPQWVLNPSYEGNGTIIRVRGN